MNKQRPVTEVWAIAKDVFESLKQKKAIGHQRLSHFWQDALGANPDGWLAKPAIRKMLGPLQRRVPLT